LNLSFHLFQLQKIDSQIDVLLKRNQQIQNDMENNSELVCAQSSLNLIELELKETEKLIIEINEKIEFIDRKLQRNNTSMYSGLVSNPKELQNIQKESALLETQKKELVESQLQVMIKQESIDGNLSQARNNLSLIKTKLHSKNSLLVSEIESIKTNLGKLATERQAILKQLPEELIIQYENLRQTKQGIAVALLDENTCSVCGSTLSPSESQNARSSTILFFCPTCQRIIYGG